MIHIEVHGVEAGREVHKLMYMGGSGLKTHLRREGVKDRELRVTVIDNRQEHNSDPYPYLRLYHDNHFEQTVEEIVRIIRSYTYTSMYCYGIQIIQVEFAPPCRDGHLP